MTFHPHCGSLVVEMGAAVGDRGWEGRERSGSGGMGGTKVQQKLQNSTSSAIDHVIC